LALVCKIEEELRLAKNATAIYVFQGVQIRRLFEKEVDLYFFSDVVSMDIFSSDRKAYMFLKKIKKPNGFGLPRTQRFSWCDWFAQLFLVFAGER
jgi:hypothetical protein